MVATHGFDKLTLRDLAQAVGKSTTVIVNLFGSKSGLLLALGEAALAQDAAFHADFFGQTNDLRADRDRLLTLLMRYLRLRASPSAGFARVWEALLLAAEPDDARRDLMRRWEALRESAWRDCLTASEHPQAARLAAPLTLCLAMEQFYAGALLDRTDYELICAEGFAAMVDRAFGLEERPATATFWYRNRLVLPRAPAETLDPDSIQRRLLDVAADQIMSAGPSQVTSRSVSLAAGTSTSTIVYHWPDMRRFLIDAVWHAVFRDMPRYLAGRNRAVQPGVATTESWLGIMAPTLSITPAAEGFYVRYARLIASICVQARLDPGLQDLAMLLRGPEGGGTFYNQEGVWPSSFDLTRLAATRFALWIKGRSLVAAATAAPVSGDELTTTADLLIARVAA